MRLKKSYFWSVDECIISETIGVEIRLEVSLLKFTTSALWEEP